MGSLFAVMAGLSLLAAFPASTLANQPETPPPEGDPVPQETSEPAPEPVSQFVVVEGQITNHIGAGAKDVQITVRRKSDDGTPGELIGETVSDTMGDFAVSVPHEIHGDFVVVFAKELHGEFSREIHVGDDDYPPYLAEVLEGNLVVMGRVIDALTEKPVNGADVNLRAMYKDWTQQTDGEGRFTIKGVLPGAGKLIVEAEGYGREVRPVARLEEFGEIVVSLKPERIVHIELVNDLDTPVAGATVECYDERRDDFRTVVTDKDGRLTLHGLHFDAVNLTLRLTHVDHVSDENFSREISVPRDKVEYKHRFVLDRAGRISGLVTDADTGKPVNGARVTTGSVYSETASRDWTDYQGRYTINGVAPGEAVVTVHRADYAPHLGRVEVQAGETARLSLQLGPSATLTGIVKTDDGKPFPGALVETTRWRGLHTLGLRAMTDSEGKFVIYDVPLGEFDISAGASGLDQVKKTVSAGTDRFVEITLAGSPLTPAELAGGWLRVGDTAPVFKATSLTGETVDLKTLRGKTVLLDFWATWCGPCVADMPHLKAVYEKFGGRKDFAMISVSLDTDEQALRRFIEEYRIPWPQIGETGGAPKAIRRYGVSAVPAVFIIGPDGKLSAVGVFGAELVDRVKIVLEDNDET